MSVFPADAHRARPLVVVAEDDVHVRTMLGLMLESQGFSVVLTVDGPDAFGAVLVHRPDAVVSDMNMPHLDGLGLCRALRALPEGRSLPVIIWSSVGADDPRVLEAIARGGVEFLSKPLAPTEVGVALWRILRHTDVSPKPNKADAGVDQEVHGFDPLPVTVAA